jgi:hypothetical protein
MVGLNRDEELREGDDGLDAPLWRVTVRATCRGARGRTITPLAMLARFYAFLTAGTGIPAILMFTEPRKFQLVK